AGIGMLDDYARRLGEALHAFPRRVGVGDVVVGELLPLDLPVAREAAGNRLRVAIERCRLMRVLAVAQLLEPRELEGECFRKIRIQRTEVVRDGAIVSSRVRERFLG